MSQVHQALDSMRATLVSCLDAASPGMVGRATLVVSVRPDGSMVLVSARLPEGIGAGPSLSCLADRVTRVRVPAPPSVVRVTHPILLGR